MVDKPAFKMGDHVEKISGSSWRGRVVGTYSTDLTREGYAVESDTEKGSVQIYPAKALRLAIPANGEQVERAKAIWKRACIGREGYCSSDLQDAAIEAINQAFREAEAAARSAALPAHYQWSESNREKFEFGRDTAADLIATLSTPTEDALSRVKVLEEAARPIVAKLEHSEASFARYSAVHPYEDDINGDDGVCVSVADLRALRTALGNKETDRHG